MINSRVGDLRAAIHPVNDVIGGAFSSAVSAGGREEFEDVNILLLVRDPQKLILWMRRPGISVPRDNLDIMGSAAFSGTSLAMSRDGDRTRPSYRAEHQSNIVASSIYQLRPRSQQYLEDLESIFDHWSDQRRGSS